jgi:hypothetical protein
VDWIKQVRHTINGEVYTCDDESSGSITIVAVGRKTCIRRQGTA